VAFSPEELQGHGTHNRPMVTQIVFRSLLADVLPATQF